jgi:hypothetical protein
MGVSDRTVPPIPTFIDRSDLRTPRRIIQTNVAGPEDVPGVLISLAFSWARIINFPALFRTARAGRMAGLAPDFIAEWLKDIEYERPHLETREMRHDCGRVALTFPPRIAGARYGSPSAYRTRIPA